MLFATHRAALPVLHQAVGICDLLAVAFVLLALLAPSAAPARGAYALALLSKEQMLLAPASLRATGGAQPYDWRRLRWLLPIALLWLGYLIALKLAGGGPGGEAYEVAFGRATFENVMIYATWTFGLFGALPEEILRRGPGAWWPGLVPLGAIVILAWRSRRSCPTILAGLIWWLLALIPVLGLLRQVYSYYLYPAFVGMAIAVSAGLWTVGSWAGRAFLYGPIRGAHRGTARSGAGAASALIVIALGAWVVVGWALQQERLDEFRRHDWLLGKSRFVGRALESFAGSFPGSARRVAIVIPPGPGEVFSTATGATLDSVPAAAPAYHMLEAVLDHGRALRAVFDLEDAVFVRRWDEAFADYDIGIELEQGWLVHCGRGRDGQVTLARLLLNGGHFEAARRYLPEVVAAYPDEARLHMAHGVALERTGAREAGRRHIELAEQLAGDAEAGGIGTAPSVDSLSGAH